MNKKSKLKSYYECKRCFYICYQKNDMIKHLKKKKICERTTKSFLQFKEEDIYDQSLIRIKSLTDEIESEDTEEVENNFIEFKCGVCNRVFTTKSNLHRHQIKYCNGNKEYENINITNNNITQNITNTQNNIINIQILKSFDEEYEDSKIDNKLKVILLLTDSKYTKTLENLLENDMNLNVLIDNSGDKGLIYNKNNFEIMDIKDIVEKSMDKLYNQLNKFHKEIEESNEFNIQKHFLDEEKKVIEQKYNDYKINETIRNKVTSFIKDIYNKKKEDTIKICNDIIVQNNDEEDGF